MAVDDGGADVPGDGGPGTDAAGRAAVVRGLASVALAAATEAAADGAPAGEAGDDGEARARLTLIQVLRAHGTADPGLVAEAALEVARMVEEPGAGPGTALGAGLGAVDADDEEPLEAAEAERVRRALGVPDPLEELAAALRAREWLERFAADLAR